jgi:hypothetical protein
MRPALFALAGPAVVHLRRDLVPIVLAVDRYEVAKPFVLLSGKLPARSPWATDHDAVNVKMRILGIKRPDPTIL